MKPHLCGVCLFLLITMAATLTLSGCSDDSCGVPGSTQACVCTTGGSGSQNCQVDGTWSECACPDGDGGWVDVSADLPDEGATDTGIEDSPEDNSYDGDVPHYDTNALEGSDIPTDTTPRDGGEENEPIEQNILEGSYTIENTDDLEEFIDFTGITGSLSINAPGLEVISLPNLRDVGVDLALDGNTHLTSLDFPVLESVGGDLSVVSNDVLTAIDFRALESVGGDLSVVNNNTVTSIEGFPMLASIGGSLVVTDNDALIYLAFPALESVGGSLNVRNWALPVCIVDALVAQLEAAGRIGGNVNTYRNRGGCICTEADGVIETNCPPPQMTVISPTPFQLYSSCADSRYEVCITVEIELQGIVLVERWGQPNAYGYGYLFVTVAPQSEPGAASPITPPDEGIVDTNFTIDVSSLPNGTYTLRVELRNNDRSLHETIPPVSVDFRKSS